MASIVKKVIASLVEQAVKPMYLAVMSRAFLLRKVAILVLLALGIAFYALAMVTFSIYGFVIFTNEYHTDVSIYLVIIDLISLSDNHCFNLQF